MERFDIGRLTGPLEKENVKSVMVLGHKGEKKTKFESSA